MAYLKVSLEQLDPLTQVETKARTLAMLGRFHHYRGQGKKAIEYLEEARLLAEPLGEPDLLTDIYSYLCGAYQWTGQYKQSNEWARRTLEYGEQINFPNAIALGYEFLAENAFIRGEWLNSLAFAARDREIGEKIGSQDRVGWSEMSTAFAYHALGELGLGLAAANRGAELAQAIGNTRLEVIVRAWRAQIAGDLGDEPQLRTDLDFILNQAGRSQQYQMYDWAYNTLCYVHAIRREWTELLESAEKYEEYTQRRHAHWYMLAYLGLGMLQEATQSSEKYHGTPRNNESIVDQAYYWFYNGPLRTSLWPGGGCPAGLHAEHPIFHGARSPPRPCPHAGLARRTADQPGARRPGARRPGNSSTNIPDQRSPARLRKG